MSFRAPEAPVSLGVNSCSISLERLPTTSHPPPTMSTTVKMHSYHLHNLSLYLSSLAPHSSAPFSVNQPGRPSRTHSLIGRGGADFAAARCFVFSPSVTGACVDPSGVLHRAAISRNGTGDWSFSSFAAATFNLNFLSSATVQHQGCSPLNSFCLLPVSSPGRRSCLVLGSDARNEVTECEVRVSLQL